MTKITASTRNPSCNLSVIIGVNGSGKTTLLHDIRNDMKTTIPEANFPHYHRDFLKSETFDMWEVHSSLWYQNLGDLNQYVRECSQNFTALLMGHKGYFIRHRLWEDIPEEQWSTPMKNYLGLSVLLHQAPPALFLDCPEVGLSPILLTHLADRIIEAKNKGTKIVLVTNSDFFLSFLGRDVDELFALGYDEQYTPKEQLLELLDRKNIELGTLWAGGHLGGTM